MENQKEITLLSFTVKNHRSIRCIEVAPDILSQRVVVIKGKEGQGKSTFLESLQTALSGSQAVKNKASLENGYLSEVCLRDGDLNIWAGAKVNESGNFSIYLYSKDDTGKKYTPIVAGKKLTPSDLAKTITTELTFNMPALFSANASIHRKLIESLFGEELNKLGIEKLKEELKEAEKARDTARALCEAKGAFMTTFKDEGYTELQLEKMERKDIHALKDKLLDLTVEVRSLESDARKNRDLELSKIKERGQELRSKIRDITDALNARYNADMIAWSKERDIIKSEQDILENYKKAVGLLPIGAATKTELIAIVENAMPKHEEGKEPEQAAIFTDDAEVWDIAYENLPELLKATLQAYSTLALKEIEVDQEKVNKINNDILSINAEIELADKHNSVFDRYHLWLEWIEKKGKYEAKQIELRKKYAQVKTGVEGMSIVPIEDDIWLCYDGSSDPEFFANKDKEVRTIFNYSTSQQGCIGLLLQAARLDLKPKALRLAILDSIPYTTMGLETVRKICMDKNLRLITAQTDDHYDVEDIPEDNIIIEGGEALFAK